MKFPFRLAPLGAEHERLSFCCREDILDCYFQTQATQDIRRRVANCFVAVVVATNHVAAYYTLSAASIPLVDLPRDEAKRLPRYPTVPAVRIGRLAVDQSFQGRSLGAALIDDAATRTLKAGAAAYTLLVDYQPACRVAEPVIGSLTGWKSGCQHADSHQVWRSPPS